MSENNLLDIASFSPRSLQSPSAWLGHLPFAAWIIREVSPKIFVELGTHYGHSYFAFCQSVAEAELSTQCYAVDTWEGDEHATHYGENVFAKVSAHHQEHYAGFSHLLRMTFDDAVTHFADESIDLLHIDGLHTYEAVRHDFETWLPKLAPGAVVMFHDTNVRERNFGVWKWWEELQKQYPNNIEFSHSYGLGVLQLNNAPDGKQLRWLQSGLPDKQRLIKYFSALGLREELKNEIAERDKQIATLYSSTSWRITRPLRLAARQMRHVRRIVELTKPAITRPLRLAAHQITRVRRIVELTKPAIARGGGLKRTFNKAILIYRCEGLEGIRRRIRIVATLQAIRPARRSGECDRNDYAEWIRRYDTLTDEARGVMRTRIDGFSRKPLISVVMPTYNSKPAWLIEAIESVRNQIYPHWELCIADDASTDKAIRPILEKYANKDARIKLVLRKKNGHIAAASNSALELVAGEWVALLDHDDLLSEQALFWVAEAINKNPDVRLIYSDEDKIDEVGRRRDPYFKCDWNVDLFYSHNMFNHLGVYRFDLVADVAGFRVGLEGSQDYDLVLRCLERIDKNQIHHVPRVLYHWRASVGSTAQSVDAKPYAMLAGERALNEHFQRKAVNAKVECVGCGYRVRYALPAAPPMVSLVILTKNGLHLIRPCVESILQKTTYQNYEILIIDNGSNDPLTIRYLAELRTEGRIRVVRDDRPFNYSALNNAGVKLVRGEIVGLLNNDTEVIAPDWLSEMVSIALQPGVGTVGARLWYPNETLQHGGVILGVGGVAGHAHHNLPRHHGGYFGRAILVQGFSAVTAACVVVRKVIYEEIGGFNEKNLSVAFNDVDFCLRVREAGYRNVWTPYAELYHHESATRGSDDDPKKQARFAMEAQFMKKRWGDLLLNDPAYSPNLTLDYGDWSLAWPPRVEVMAFP